MGGRVKSLQGIDTPGVAKLTWRYETPGVATKREGVPIEDGQGQGGDGNPPITQATKESGAGGGDKYMAQGTRMATPLRPQRGTLED